MFKTTTIFTILISAAFSMKNENESISVAAIIPPRSDVADTSLRFTESYSPTPSVPPTKAKKYRKRLLIGEGNFSYAKALIEKHKIDHPELCKHVVATELDQVNAQSDEGKENIRYLSDKGVLFLFQIDACKLSNQVNNPPYPHFSRIHFNFPNDRSDYMTGNMRFLMENFFKESSVIQKKGDRVHIVLPEEPGPKRHFHHLWYGICDASQRVGYALIKKRKFGTGRYPGYNHTQTNGKKSETKLVTASQHGKEYIFEKDGNPIPRLEIRREPLHYGNYETSSINYFYGVTTDDDSSDYETDNLET